MPRPRSQPFVPAATPVREGLKMYKTIKPKMLLQRKRAETLPRSQRFIA